MTTQSSSHELNSSNNNSSSDPISENPNDDNKNIPILQTQKKNVNIHELNLNDQIINSFNNNSTFNNHDKKKSSSHSKNPNNQYKNNHFSSSIKSYKDNISTSNNNTNSINDTNNQNGYNKNRSYNLIVNNQSSDYHQKKKTLNSNSSQSITNNNTEQIINNNSDDIQNNNNSSSIVNNINEKQTNHISINSFTQSSNSNSSPSNYFNTSNHPSTLIVNNNIDQQSFFNNSLSQTNSHNIHSNSSQGYASASLYVGDLHPDVTESLLYQIFNLVAPVASIRVCRDAVTRRSLGYGYVNYHNVSEAERALDTLNYTNIKGIPVRIMWSHRDPSIRKNGSGNVFVKNLDKNIDNKALYDTFSLFGNILSCKVKTDDKGRSLGFGFVHYESDEDAKVAIEKVNGMHIGNKVVFVGQFLKKTERSVDNNIEQQQNYQNIYIKNIPDSWDEAKLQKIFEQFGETTSIAMKSDKKGRKFAFINYCNAEDARKAVEMMNAKVCTPEGVKDDNEVESLENNTTSSVDTNKNNDTKLNTLFVGPHQPKLQRVAMLKTKFESNNDNNKSRKGSSTNLYIKNLSDSIDDNDLLEVFKRFGPIISAKVMMDSKNVSRGFGFVCFENFEDAKRAVEETHSKLMHNKPLYVALAEKRDQRLARLQQRYRLIQHNDRQGPVGVIGVGPNVSRGGGIIPGTNNGLIGMVGGVIGSGVMANNHSGLCGPGNVGGGAVSVSGPVINNGNYGNNNISASLPPMQFNAPSQNIYYNSNTNNGSSKQIAHVPGGCGPLIPFQHPSNVLYWRPQSGISYNMPGGCGSVGGGSAVGGITAVSTTSGTSTGNTNNPGHQQGVVDMVRHQVNNSISNVYPHVNVHHHPFSSVNINPGVVKNTIPSGGSSSVGGGNVLTGGGGGTYYDSQINPVMMNRINVGGGLIMGGANMNSNVKPIYNMNSTEVVGNGSFKFTSQARNRIESQNQQSVGRVTQQQGSLSAIGNSNNCSVVSNQLPAASFPSSANSQKDISCSTINSTSDASLTAAALSAAGPSQQKQILGEKLFPLIAKFQPELAGKITGMMLEMDNNELIPLIESEAQLKLKIDEALRVLQQAVDH